MQIFFFSGTSNEIDTRFIMQDSLAKCFP